MKVLLTGGAGFVGRHVLAALRGRAMVRALVHERDVQADEIVRGDLASLPDCTEGIDLVIHAACHLSDDEAACNAVNARGTAALVGQARGRRIVYVSNAAVYGDAVSAGLAEDACIVAPVTPISRSRAVAERAVLDAGGLVVRPMFVYGAGDTRFIPAIAKAARALPLFVDGGRARFSVIGADDLGAAVADLALSDAPSGAWHATDGHPISHVELIGALHAELGVPVPRRSVPFAVARVIVAASSLAGVGGSSASARHRLFLIARDHHYDSTRLWAALGRRPRPFRERQAELATWYAKGT